MYRVIDPNLEELLSTSLATSTLRALLGSLVASTQQTDESAGQTSENAPIRFVPVAAEGQNVQPNSVQYPLVFRIASDHQEVSNCNCEIIKHSQKCI